MMCTPFCSQSKNMLYYLSSSRSPVRWAESAGQNSSGNLTFYLSVYGGIAAANSIFTALRALLFALGTVHAATTIHRRLLQRVLRVSRLFDLCCVISQCPLSPIFIILTHYPHPIVLHSSQSSLHLSSAISLSSGQCSYPLSHLLTHLHFLTLHRPVSLIPSPSL